MVILLDDDIWFPSPYGGDPDGLIAYGGDLKPKSVIRKNFLSFLMTAIRKLALYKLDL